jgi:hypothetical protein
MIPSVDRPVVIWPFLVWIYVGVLAAFSTILMSHMLDAFFFEMVPPDLDALAPLKNLHRLDQLHWLMIGAAAVFYSVAAGLLLLAKRSAFFVFLLAFSISLADIFYLFRQGQMTFIFDGPPQIILHPLWLATGLLALLSVGWLLKRGYLK